MLLLVLDSMSNISSSSEYCTDFKDINNMHNIVEIGDIFYESSKLIDELIEELSRYTTESKYPLGHDREVTKVDNTINK